MPRSTSPERPKRAKIFRACKTCVASKTRCEDVTGDGCGLCRKRRKPCSLSEIAGRLGDEYEREPSERERWRIEAPAAPLPRDWQSNGSASARHPAQAPARPTSEMDELRARLAEAERRVARTEAALADVEQQLRHASWDATAAPPHQPASADEEVQIGGPLKLATLNVYQLNETMFAPACLRAYPDPVLRGIMSAGHVELAWHGFKARIAPLLPLPPFLAVGTPLPQHGFVVLAALQHVPSLERDVRRRLSGLVDECILLAMGGAASVDVILALLVLALAPPADDKGTSATAFRLVSLAYSMGIALSLDTRAETALRCGDDLNDEHWSEALWQLQLWAAVSNRYALLSLMNGQLTRLPPLVATDLPVLARESVEVCNKHLRAEAELANIFAPFIAAMGELEHVSVYDVERVRELHPIWKDTYEAARAFAASAAKPPLVRTDARCIEFAMGLRLTALATWIPSPLKDARQATMQCLGKFPGTLTAMMELVLDASPSSPDTPSPAAPMDPAALPAYIVQVACTALIAFRRAVAHVARVYPHVHLVDSGKLDAAEGRLRTLGGAPRLVLDEGLKLLAESCKALATLQPQPLPKEGEPEEPLGLDFDIMDWDLSLLYPQLGSLPAL